MMNNQVFKSKLKQALNSELPAWKAHLKLAPIERAEAIKLQKIVADPKPSAVMLILYKEDKETKVLFILRSVYDGAHSGQISFPGGQKEDTDTSLIETAIRETQEEIGIKVDSADIVGKLSNLYIPNSNFIVEPYVAFLENIEELIPDRSEVQQIYRIHLNQLLDEKTIQTKEVLFLNARSISAPCFYVDELIIWGATAMILNELVDIIKSNGLVEIYK